MIDEMAIKNKQAIITAELWWQTVEQLHDNPKGTEKTRLLAYKPTYWININTNKNNAIKPLNIT